MKRILFRLSVVSLLFVFAIFGVADPELLPLDPLERGVCILALVAVLFAVTLATSGKDSDA